MTLVYGGRFFACKRLRSWGSPQQKGKCTAGLLEEETGGEEAAMAETPAVGEEPKQK
jgi:hypothetical protein